MSNHNFVCLLWAMLLLASNISVSADVGVWQQRSPLPTRNGDAPLALCMDRFLFTFGGQTDYNSPKLDELWGLDLANASSVWESIPKQRKPQPWPIARSDPLLWCHENRLFLSGGKGRFGGSKYDTNGQDTWMYDVDRRVWTELNTQEGATLPPQGGGGISNTPSALDAASGDFFVVYRSWRSFYTSIWRFNATSYTWSKAADLVVNAMNLRETSSILDTVAFESETSELSFLFRTRTLSRRYAYNVVTGSLTSEDLQESPLYRLGLLYAAAALSIGNGRILRIGQNEVSNPTLYRGAPDTAIWDKQRRSFVGVARLDLLNNLPPAVYSPSRKTAFVTVGIPAALYSYELGCPNSCSGQGTCQDGLFCGCSNNSVAGFDCSAVCSDTCLNGGSCVKNRRNSVCGCPAGYFGANCSEHIPCYHGYVEMGSGGSPKCQCDLWWDGPSCNFTCSESNCFGTCDKTTDRCVCPPHTSGERCEIDEAVNALGTLECKAKDGLDLVGLTWCKSQNPAISPLRLPPPANQSAEILDLSSCKDVDSKNVLCKVITAVKTFGWTTYGRPTSFVLSGTADGQFLAANFQNEKVGFRWRLASAAVRHVEAGISSSHTFVMASDGQNFRIVGLTSYVYKNFNVTMRPWMPDGSQEFQASSIQLFVVDGENETSLVYPFAVVQDYKSHETIFRMYEFQVDKTGTQVVLKNDITWKIQGTADDAVRVAFAPQPFGFEGYPGFAASSVRSHLPKCSSWGDITPFRLLGLISDRLQASVFTLPTFPLSRSGTFTVDVSKSVVFRTSDSMLIRDAEFYPECFSAPNASASSMIAAFVLRKRENTESSELRIVRLDEFTLQSGYCGVSSPMEDLTLNLLTQMSTNSVCKDISLTKCPLDSFWDGIGCRNRTQFSITLPFLPSETIRKFIGPPEGRLSPDALMQKEIDKEFNDTISDLTKTFMYDAFFFLSKDRTQLQILGVQQDLATWPTPTIVSQQLNKFDTPSEVREWDVSDNGQHIFVAISRRKWEIESQERLVSICKLRKENNTVANMIYADFEPLCNTPFGDPQPPSYADFVFMLSMCPPDTYCPAFGKVPGGYKDSIFSTFAPDGKFTVAPGLLKDCEPGFYCRNSRKIPCPQGFVCPKRGMSAPDTCSDWTSDPTVTCFGEGLIYPKKCPKGFICLTPESPPIPAPPGYASPGLTDGPGSVCNVTGQFCPLAAPVPIPKCPPGFFCNSTTSILPVQCITAYDRNGTKVHNETTYCPAGSTTMELCPAGFVCEVPWEKKQCEPGEWCPEGSQIRQTCPAGRVCRTPATNDICPGGYFCPTNTWEPRKCSPLALCTEGSSAQRGWLALSLEFAVLAIVLGIYYFVHRVRATRRKARVEAALKQRKANNRFLLRSEESEMEVDYDNEDAPLLLSDSDISDVESIPSPRTSSTRIPGPGPVVSERPSIDIEFNDIELKVSGGKKTVLQRVSGRFKPGQLSAVMGPSGAGKSSLLSVLSGESTKSAGEILINGTPDSLTRFKSVIGFVPQEDIMHRTLSVVEILRFNAAMRLPRGVRESEREDLVEDILDILNLKKVKYSLIGDENKRGLSGGERKRVNIGMELAADPSVLFLDEPTSGLDSSSAVQVCKCLKTIAARSNMTIVCVIHQPRPEVFQLFDSVLFLAPGGRTVFQGGVNEASAYFGEIGYPVPAMSNPADFYMDVIYACATGDAGSLDIELKNLPEEWKQRIEDVKVEEVPRAGSIASMGSKKSKFSPRLTADFFTQLWHFFLRSCVLQMRDLRSILLNIFLVFISGLLLGFVYADASYIGPPSAAKRSMCPDFISSLCDMPEEDTYVLQFALMNMALGLTAVAGALPTFGDERVQFWRESRTGLNSLAFFLGKNLAGIPMIIIPPLFLLSIFYFLTTPGAGFFQMYAVLLVVQFTCVAVGYLISLLMAPANALLAGVVFVIVSTMFSGANPTLAKLKGFGVPGMIMTSISFSRWANEALYSSLLVTYQVQYDIEPGLRYWGYEIANYPVIDFLALGGLALFLRIVAYLVLFFVHRNKKI